MKLENKAQTVEQKQQQKQKKQRKKGLEGVTTRRKKITIPIQSLEKLEEKAWLCDEYKEYLQQIKAEFENYKKRQEKIVNEIRQFANENLIKELIPVLENFERAVDEKHLTKPEALFEGVRLIKAQLNDLLKKYGLKKMTTVGVEFNPSLHEALMHVPSDKYSEGVIIEEVNGGYILNNKVIKYAQVIVSKGKVEEAKDNNDKVEKCDKKNISDSS